MIRLKNLKIGTKLIVSTSLLVTTAIVIISVNMGLSTYQMAERNARSLGAETAYRYANALKSKLETSLDEARTLAAVFQAAQIYSKEVELTRLKANRILQHFIENRPDFLTVYVVFEPNAFDGKDAEFVGTPGHDKTGRFLPHWARDKNQKGFLEAQANYDIEGLGDFYLVPKKVHREAIIEPYFSPVQGQEVLVTSMVVPIFNEDKGFLGIAGIDLDLNFLREMMLNQKIHGFQAAYANVYSATGIVVSHLKTEYLGKNLNDYNPDQEFINLVQNNKPFIIERISDVIEKPVITYGAPIEIGDTATSWMVVVSIPKEELMARTLHLIYISLLLGLAMVILAIVAIYLLSKSLVSPLLQMNKQLKTLAEGKLGEEQFSYESQDEIAEMINSVQQLRGSIKATIAQAKAITAGDYSAEVKLLSDEDQLGLALSSMIYILREVVQQANAIAVGDYSKPVTILSQQDQLGQALSHMTQKLREMTAKQAEQDWLKAGLAQLNERLSGDQEVMSLTKTVISFLTTYLGAKVGLFYLLKLTEDPEPQPYLQAVASYAYVQRSGVPNQFRLGEGLVGEVALTRKLIIYIHSPEEYTYITASSLSQAVPRYVTILPVLYENTLKGVIELGSFNSLPDTQQEFLEQAVPNIGIAVNTAESRTRMKELLTQSQQQAQELQARQAEMQQVNAMLQTQSEELQAQQEELRQTNDELEHRTQDLERQKNDIRNKNTLLEKTQADMETARAAIEVKAKELELASKYKSDFLANMSHELRTPLNSLLILAQLLAANKGNNLTTKQVEYAQTIHSAGADLLNLINDILDLSKIEAGKVEAIIEAVSLLELVKGLEQKFRQVAEEKQLTFDLTIAENLPTVLYTDGQRVKQIINNLLSNAFKFTHHGTVTLTIERPQPRDEVKTYGLTPTKTVAIRVTDTGIGIPEDKRMVIFEAFQQVDGTTSRKYGGTGLGLSISRQLSRLLGGELKVTSEEGKGSVFTLYLPETLTNKPSVRKTPATSPSTGAKDWQSSKDCQSSSSNGAKDCLSSPERLPVPEAIIDDRNDLKPDDKSLLIIEDDRKFSRILMELAQEKGFKCLIAEDGGIGLQLADEYRPAAITLDLKLSMMGGWTVMEKLKSNPNTRHIPVHFISGTDQHQEAHRMGAIGYALKPVGMSELSETFKRIEEAISKTLKQVLIVVDNLQRQPKITEMVGGDNVETVLVSTKAEVYQQLHATAFDCMVVDVDTEQQTGIQLLDEMQRDETLSQLPVIVYAERELTPLENGMLQGYAQFLTVKAVKSPARLLEEVTLFLHQVESNLPADKQQMLRTVYDKEAILAHKKILLVDDDIRNVFALTVTLDDKGMEVLTAGNGIEALELLKQSTGVDIVLMDIMMPEMDGYETMRRIRAQPQFQKLPIIALTAKAMKEDKAKCIEAGANDYLAKPVELSKLLSLMRVWLYQ